MFHLASNFNQDLSTWVIYSVEDMNGMFSGTTGGYFLGCDYFDMAFNQPIMVGVFQMSII
jgi:hypothetical protein